MVIINFRDLQSDVDEALKLFGDENAGGLVLLKGYDEYFTKYMELLNEIRQKFPLGVEILGENEKAELVGLFGKLLKLRNILTCFDKFSSDDMLMIRDLQDYQSEYIDIYNDIKSQKASEKTNINNDIEFEIQLVRQVDVNIDYILNLVAEYAKGGCKDKEIIISINKAIGASIDLRSKKDLIEQFIAEVSVGGASWQELVKREYEKDLAAIVSDEKLKNKNNETRNFIQNSLKDAMIKDTGTQIVDIMPKISFFDSDRNAKKERIIERLNGFCKSIWG